MVHGLLIQIQPGFIACQVVNIGATEDNCVSCNDPILVEKIRRLPLHFNGG